jgi:dTDP-4-dehydrorhamnose reductase
MAHIVVTGPHGMLGHVVCRVLSKKHRVVGVCRAAHDSYPALDGVDERNFALADQVDLADPTSLSQRLPSEASVVVNCAGLIKQRAEANDPMAILDANALIPRRLAEWCDANGARLIHVSTDCVFSGHRGNYGEEETPDPVDLYGLSKVLGEITTAPHLTLRTSIIGPQLRGREGLFAWFVSQHGRVVQGYANAIFSGLTTLAFADVLDRLIAGPSAPSGLYHVAAAPISKYALLQELDRRLALGVTIQRDDSVVCDRSLDGRRFCATSGIAIPGWEEMLDTLCRNLNNGATAWTAAKSPTKASPARAYSSQAAPVRSVRRSLIA